MGEHHVSAISLSFSVILLQLFRAASECCLRKAPILAASAVQHPSLYIRILTINRYQIGRENQLLEGS